MVSKLPKTDVRLEKINIEKLKYIAYNNCRSLNKEIRFVLLQHIRQYEKANGEIVLENGEFRVDEE